MAAALNNFMFYFDIIPVILAIAALFVMGNTYSKARRSSDKVSIFLSSIACIMLIIAQTGWQYSVYVLNDIQGTAWANYVWSVFNILVTVIFNVGYIRYNRATLDSFRFHKKDDKSTDSSSANRY